MTTLHRVRSAVMAALVSAVVIAGLSGCEPAVSMITGTVSLQDSGAPAAGLVVTAFADDTETEVASVVADANGSFAFAQSDLPGGDYRLRLGSADWWDGASSWADAQPVSASSAAPGSIVATISRSTIAGTVTASGAPKAGATVDIFVRGSELRVASAITGADGTYGVTVASGLFDVRVSAVGRATAYQGGIADRSLTTAVSVGSGDPVTVNVDLGVEKALLRWVFDGAVVTDAVVIALHDATGSPAGVATTNSDGSALFRGLSASTYRFVVLRGPHLTPAPGAYPAKDVNVVLWEVVTRPVPFDTVIFVPTRACLHSDIRAGAELAGRDLAGMDLRGCSLAGADLTGADLEGALLQSVDLWSTILSGANLAGANLQSARMDGTWLEGASFENADLTGVVSRDIVGTPAALPSGWRLANGYLVGPGVDLSGIDLANTNLAGVDLAGTNLTGANLTGANLTGALLEGATIVDTNFSGTDLRGADLAGVDLRGAHLSDANLSGVDLAGTDLTGANLAGADLEGATIAGTNFTGADLRGADLVGVDLTYANLAAVNLAGSSLAGFDFAGANLAGADLSGADLVGADLGGVDLTDASLSGANLTNTRFLGTILVRTDLSNLYVTGMDLTGADLTNAVITNSNLPDAILVGANLTGADLRYSYLIRVDLTDADLTGANLIYVQLIQVDLSGADLIGADLRSAQLVQVNLDGADLSGADLFWMESSGITGTPAALPAGYAVIGGVLTLV